MYNVKWHLLSNVRNIPTEIHCSSIVFSTPFFAAWKSSFIVPVNQKPKYLQKLLMLERARKRSLSTALVYWRCEKSLCLHTRVEPRSNEGPRDWRNMFGIQGFVILYRGSFPDILQLGYLEYRSFYRGLL